MAKLYEITSIVKMTKEARMAHLAILPKKPSFLKKAGIINMATIAKNVNLARMATTEIFAINNTVAESATVCLKP